MNSLSVIYGVKQNFVKIFQSAIMSLSNYPQKYLNILVFKDLFVLLELFLVSNLVGNLILKT